MKTTCPSCKHEYRHSPTLNVEFKCECGYQIRIQSGILQPRVHFKRGNHWLTLHEFAFKASTTQSEKQAFITKWVADIPQHTPPNCSCKANWDALNFSFATESDEAFKRSCVDGHNLVRTKLGQPTFSYEQAAKRWTGPRVGFIADSYGIIGGTETFHRTLIPRLRERVQIVGFVATRFHPGNPSLLKVPYRTGIDAAKELADSCDVLITWAGPLDRILDKVKRPRVIGVNHGDPSGNWDCITPHLEWIDQIVGVHPSILEKHPGAKWINNCVDPLHIVPSGQESKLRIVHSIPKDAKIVFFAHRLSKEKRPLLALEIAKHLPDEWIMVIAGSGAMESAVRKSLPKQARFIGAVDHPSDWLAISHRFLSLSEKEGYGLAVAEALAFGIPVVSTACGVAKDRCINVPIDADATTWAAALQAEQHTAQQVDLCDVDRFIDEWEAVIRGSFQNQ